jgi:tetratricopeptide (TPR) repeat protein/TolB-like protein
VRAAAAENTRAALLTVLCYNEHRMSMRLPRTRRFLRILPFLLFLISAAPLAAGKLASSTPAAHPGLRQEGVFLVFPFENSGAKPSLDWIGEGLEELTIQRLSAAGQPVFSHSGRLAEMDRYGLPATAKLSRATMLHIAQELDADYVVFGNFTADDKDLTVNIRLLHVSPVSLLPVISERGPLPSLMDLHLKLIWRMLGTCDRNYPLKLPDFSKLQRPLGLGAFEQYVRGLLANDDKARLRNLKESARLEPDWPDPAFAIGDVYFQRNDCAAALPWFAKIPPANPRSVEAIFSAGVCRLRLGQPDKAEEAFVALQEELHRNLASGADLPEILNDLALSRARQNNFAAALTALGRASDIDPDEDDYPFNLGLLALQKKDVATAATQFGEAVRREPDNAEDRAFLIYALEKQGKKTEAAAQRDAAVEVLGDKALPLLKIESKNGDTLAKYQRVKRELDVTSLRLELEGPQAQGSLMADNGTSEDGAVAHLRRGRQELGAGMIDSAEMEFRAALASDPHNASAHRDLGEIYRRRRKLDEAARELQLSLAERDSAAVRTTLARIFIEQKKLDLARVELEKAVKLAPNYPDAKDLLDRLAKSWPTGGVK